MLFYLLVAAGGVTHRDLFFESPVKLPFLNVDLPLKGFFWLGPALFLVIHAYVLLHFVMLAGKVGVFDVQLRAQIDDPEVRTRLRRQLPSNIFVQFLAGPREVRDGIMGFLLWLIALISLVIGPVALLVFFQLQFLPYHEPWITWYEVINWTVESLKSLKQRIEQNVPERIGENIPENQLRAWALARIEPRLDPKTPLHEEDQMAKRWEELQRSPPPWDAYEANLAKQWWQIGCSPEGAPYVIAGLIRKMSSGASPFPLMSDQVPKLAADFLKEGCAGARGLSDDAKGKLKTLRDYGRLGQPLRTR